MPLDLFKENFLKTLLLGYGDFCYCSFDLVDFVDGFHIGCV